MHLYFAKTFFLQKLNYFKNQTVVSLKMPRLPKYEDQVTERIPSSGKVFMYKSSEWEILFPIADVIRLFKPNTIISYKIGKGQGLFRTYGTGYNHTLLGNGIKTKQDYLFALRMVQCVFIFTDTNDLFTTNLISIAKKNNIIVVCYSSIDSVYHLFFESKIEKINDPKELLDRVYGLMDLGKVKKLAELFSEFEILEPEIDTKETTLEKCVKIFKDSTEKELNKKEYTRPFDPHLAKLKKMERDRIKIKYDDEPPPKPQFNILSKFLTKR